MHADEYAVRADETVPALTNACFNGDLDRRIADRRRLVFGALLLEQLEAGNRNDAGRMAVLLQHVAGA